MGLTRSMIKQKELPNYFWVEAVATAVYLINIAVTKVLKTENSQNGLDPVNFSNIANPDVSTRRLHTPVTS
ncbi:hypothetical protein HanPI659440_Chr07g0253391 [Helianthus annuus]|nr:hypothetical protein HanPI659440_Chr07g0253391 [Helianthus annuus]